MRLIKTTALLLILLLMNVGNRVAAQTKTEHGMVLGPATISLGTCGGVLVLPKGFAFVDQATAESLFERHKETVPHGLVGLVLEKGGKVEWDALLKYDPCGYVKDEDAGKLNAGELLQSIKDGTAQANEQRKQNGQAALDVIGWSKPPSYDRKNHALSWSILGSDEGDKSKIVNLYLRTLGRYGTMSVTVIGDPKDATVLQSKLDLLSTNVHFLHGHDYASFKAGDKVSNLTMATLITGGAGALLYGAAKVGLLAKLLPMLLALKKALILLVVGIVTAIKKFFAKLTGKKSAPTPADPPPTPPGPGQS